MYGSGKKSIKTPDYVIIVHGFGPKSDFGRGFGQMLNEPNLANNHSSVKSSLYRSRQKKFPTLPRRREDINLDGEWSQTQTGENFVAHHVDDMIIFTTDENLRRLSSAKTLFMDGTFEMFK